jgi:uroporphyrinogen decarboxylase
MRKRLTRQQVIDVIERKSTIHAIPLVFHKWWGIGLYELHGKALDTIAADIPDDIFTAWFTVPGNDISPVPNPSYRWGYPIDYKNAEQHGIAHTTVLLPDFDDLDAYLSDFPDPDEPHIFDPVEQALSQAGDRYRLGCWWELFHERFWAIRGMQNLMLDYFDHMDELKILGKRLLKFHKGIVDRYAALGFDGIFTSDDLGHQHGPLMSPHVFEELYFPLYKEFCSYVHSKNMHVFLHSCGDNTLLMEYLIEAGIDVLHPIQTGCMDEAETVANFGDRISFLAGVDVQHLLPEGSREQVRDGVRRLIDTMYRPSGGLLLAAGNGIMPGIPLENIEEMLLQIATYKR